MDKDKQEKLAQKKSNELFNSITEKVKPENQNQTHNSRREGMAQIRRENQCKAPGSRCRIWKHQYENTDFLIQGRIPLWRPVFLLFCRMRCAIINKKKNLIYE